jgi:hypothetical protein
MLIGRSGERCALSFRAQRGILPWFFPPYSAQGRARFLAALGMTQWSIRDVGAVLVAARGSGTSREGRPDDQ